MCYAPLMRWTVETLNKIVDAELEALPPGLRARFDHMVKVIEDIGLEQLPASYVKHIEGKIWELRAKAEEGIARGLYITVKGRRVIILHVFVKKSSKTPKSNLNAARQRLKEVLI